jgi:hypothetical protein
MTFIPHCDTERQQMLDAVGVNTLDDLFGDVPEHVRFPSLTLPPPVSQLELAAEMRALAARNIDARTGPRSWALASTATIALRPSTTSCSAASSPPPTRRIRLRSARACCRPCSSTKP